MRIVPEENLNRHFSAGGKLLQLQPVWSLGLADRLIPFHVPAAGRAVGFERLLDHGFVLEFNRFHHRQQKAFLGCVGQDEAKLEGFSAVHPFCFRNRP